MGSQLWRNHLLWCNTTILLRIQFLLYWLMSTLLFHLWLSWDASLISLLRKHHLIYSSFGNSGNIILIFIQQKETTSGITKNFLVFHNTSSQIRYSQDGWLALVFWLSSLDLSCSLVQLEDLSNLILFRVAHWKLNLLLKNHLKHINSIILRWMILLWEMELGWIKQQIYHKTRPKNSIWLSHMFFIGIMIHLHVFTPKKTLMSLPSKNGLKPDSSNLLRFKTPFLVILLSGDG